jgi:glyoxylase-like metal-dependent hydrolase (beta-lactamase superfamily II)
MTSADEFQALNDSAYHWSVYEPAVKCEIACTALKVGAGLVIADPVPLAEPAWQELLGIAPLRAIVITNGNHARHAAALRETCQVPIVTAPLTRKDLGELRPDVILLENELLYGIALVPIPGATPGETALYFREGGVLVIGDAVINVSPEKGLELLPDTYCDDPEQNRASLRKLLSLDFHTITFAHGAPVTSRAKEKWAALLDA